MRLKTLAAAASLLVLLVSVSASAQPRFSGYYEHTLQGDWHEKTDEILLDYSKLRLDIEAGGGEGELSFRGNLNVIRYHTTVTYDITPYLPDHVVDRLNQLSQIAGQDLTRFQLDRQRIWLDNAWLTWRRGNLRLRAGKQQLSWGPGYSINPTDLFHTKTLIDPTYEKEGVTSLRLDYRWGVGGQLTAIMAPAQSFETSGYALRAGTFLKSIGYDVYATAHHVVDSTAVDPTTLMPVRQDRDALGLEFSGELLGMGFWFEGNYNWMEREDEFLRFVTGLDYTFGNGLYVMGEFMLNTRAEEEPPYPVHDWLGNLLYGEPVVPNWILAGVRKDLTMLMSADLYVYGSTDGSLMVSPRFSYSLAQNADLTLFGALTAGDDEGGFPPGLVSLFVRATVYF